MHLEQIPDYVAPVATMIAAMMTAANLGARVTGWGFVVFTVGSICWSIIGITTGQQNLLLSNAFLTVVNLVGIWRWLGRNAQHSDGGRRATERSEQTRSPTLMSACTLMNAAINDRNGDKVATVVDAMLSCEGRDIVYLVATRGGVGGVGETLHAVDPASVELCGDGVTTRLTAEDFDRLPALEPDRWPSELPRGSRTRAAA